MTVFLWLLALFVARGKQTQGESRNFFNHPEVAFLNSAGGSFDKHTPCQTAFRDFSAPPGLRAALRGSILFQHAFYETRPPPFRLRQERGGTDNVRKAQTPTHGKQAATPSEPQHPNARFPTAQALKGHPVPRDSTSSRRD